MHALAGVATTLGDNGLGAHLYLVAKLGTTAPPWLRADKQPKSLREERV